MRFHQMVVTAAALLAVSFAQPGRAAEAPPPPFTGLVIQVEGQQIKPAMSVRVLSEDGAVVYGELKQLSPEATNKLIETGMAAFASTWQDVEQRCGQHPLLIKSVAVKGEDIVISRADAEQVRQADVKKHFLADLQVAVFTPPPPQPKQEETQTITQQDLPGDEPPADQTQDNPKQLAEPAADPSAAPAQ